MLVVEHAQAEEALLLERVARFEATSPWQCGNGLNCTAESTCCEDQESVYGCCIYANAVCCAGTGTCCPFGFVCDISHARCVQTS